MSRGRCQPRTRSAAAVLRFAADWTVADAWAAAGMPERMLNTAACGSAVIVLRHLGSDAANPFLAAVGACAVPHYADFNSFARDAAMSPDQRKAAGLEYPPTVVRRLAVARLAEPESLEPPHLRRWLPGAEPDPADDGRIGNLARTLGRAMEEPEDRPLEQPDRPRGHRSRARAEAVVDTFAR